MFIFIGNQLLLSLLVDSWTELSRNSGVRNISAVEAKGTGVTVTLCKEKYGT